METEVPPGEDKPLVAASMFGNTTACVVAAKAILEEAGYEVLVFHATGTGGKTMESLIEGGLIAGVLDVTTTEWADELVGGVLAAGPTRLEAAARNGVPAVVTPACLDMVNFWAPETVPEKFRSRKFYPHNPNITLMRTTPDECRQLGRILAEKLNLSTGPVTVLIPRKGLERDRRRRRAVLVAGGRPGPVRLAEVGAPRRHPRDRDRQQRQRSPVRPTLRRDPPGQHDEKGSQRFFGG